MEISLFSGFELTSIPPLLLNYEQNMTEMLHGFYNNNLWFIFANVSSECPICVQYSIRSGFIVSSIRPAYARIFPVSREDLAADMFFHTQMGSNLLKDITDDDLITWFQKNETYSDDFIFAENESCYRITDTAVNLLKPHTTTVETAMENTSIGTSSTSSTPLELDVTTYTINVDEDSIKNLTDVDQKNISQPLVFTTMLPKKQATTTERVLPPTKQAKSEPKKKTIKKLSKKLVLIKRKKENIDETMHKNVSTDVTSEAPSKLMVDANVYSPKHVNTKKLDVPLKYLESKEDESQIPATFNPEKKNDRYLLLDKEQLWGMLREVVDDELNKSIKLEEIAKKN